MPLNTLLDSLEHGSLDEGLLRSREIPQGIVRRVYGFMIEDYVREVFRRTPGIRIVEKTDSCFSNRFNYCGADYVHTPEVGDFALQGVIQDPSKGLNIIKAPNMIDPVGEIDILAETADTFVCAEVKTMFMRAYGPEVINSRCRFLWRRNLEDLAIQGIRGSKPVEYWFLVNQEMGDLLTVAYNDDRRLRNNVDRFLDSNNKIVYMNINGEARDIIRDCVMESRPEQVASW